MKVFRMGMLDSFYIAHRGRTHEIQTKQFGCAMEHFSIGDRVDSAPGFRLCVESFVTMHSSVGGWGDLSQPPDTFYPNRSLFYVSFAIVNGFVLDYAVSTDPTFANSPTMQQRLLERFSNPQWQTWAWRYAAQLRKYDLGTESARNNDLAEFLSAYKSRREPRRGPRTNRMLRMFHLTDLPKRILTTKEFLTRVAHRVSSWAHIPVQGGPLGGDLRKPDAEPTGKFYLEEIVRWRNDYHYDGPIHSAVPLLPLAEKDDSCHVKASDVITALKNLDVDALEDWFFVFTAPASRTLKLRKAGKRGRTKHVNQIDPSTPIHGPHPPTPYQLAWSKWTTLEKLEVAFWIRSLFTTFLGHLLGGRVLAALPIPMDLLEDPIQKAVDCMDFVSRAAILYGMDEEWFLHLAKTHPDFVETIASSASSLQSIPSTYVAFLSLFSPATMTLNANTPTICERLPFDLAIDALFSTKAWHRPFFSEAAQQAVLWWKAGANIFLADNNGNTALMRAASVADDLDEQQHACFGTLAHEFTSPDFQQLMETLTSQHPVGHRNKNGDMLVDILDASLARCQGDNTRAAELRLLLTTLEKERLIRDLPGLNSLTQPPRKPHSL